MLGVEQGPFFFEGGGGGGGGDNFGGNRRGSGTKSHVTYIITHMLPHLRDNKTFLLSLEVM